MWYRNNRSSNNILWILTLTIIIAFTWSYYTEIQQVIRANGKVVPTGQNKLVQHLEGGIIAEILIKEGDVVEKGQVLFRIKNEYATAELNSQQIEKYALQAKKYRLQTQLNGKKKIIFSKELIKNAKEVIKTESILLQDSFRKFEKEQQILVSINHRKEQRINELTSQKNNLKKELDLASIELKLNQKLQKSGAASQRDILDSQKRFQSLKTKFDIIDLSIPAARSEANETQSRVEQSKANYIFNLREDLNKTETLIEKLTAKQSARQDQQSRSDVISSVKGVVNKLLVNTIGGIILSGDILASITPLDTSLIVEAKVQEVDRAEIWIGQAVKVKLRAYDYSIYGSIDGVISLISPDSFVDERRSNKYYYQVSITVQQSFSEDKPILPGMIADVDILAGKKTIFSILKGPISKVWDKALTES